MKRNSLNTLPLISLILSAATLSGCSTYSETFDCPPGRGVGCKSLSEVNQMVEKGQLPLEKSPSEDEVLPVKDLTKSVDPKTQDSKEHRPWIEAKDDRYPINLLSQEALSKDNLETHIKIWVVGYEDEEGNYHSPSYVYASLKNDPKALPLARVSLKEHSFSE